MVQMRFLAHLRILYNFVSSFLCLISILTYPLLVIISSKQKTKRCKISVFSGCRRMLKRLCTALGELLLRLALSANRLISRILTLMIPYTTVLGIGLIVHVETNIHLFTRVEAPWMIQSSLIPRVLPLSVQ